MKAKNQNNEAAGSKEPGKLKFYFTSMQDRVPTLRVEGKVGIADPCNIVPDKLWREFLQTYYANCDHPENANLSDRAVFIFHGVPFRCERTDGDGMWMGVAVDTATLAEFPVEQAKAVFGFEMIEAEGR